MILDKRNAFAVAASAIQAASTTALIGDVIDLGLPGETPTSPKSAEYLIITVDTAFVSANNNTAQFKLVSDAQAALAVDGTASEHVLTSAQAAPATFPAGKKFVFPLPSPGVAYERFLGVLLVTGAGASGITAGTFSAHLAIDAGEWKAYPDALA